jgi:hypothetical protein
MATIVQRCPAPECVGDVRYSTVALVGGSGREGTCDRCRRVYRLNPGRAPTEIDRIDLSHDHAGDDDDAAGVDGVVA